MGSGNSKFRKNKKDFINNVYIESSKKILSSEKEVEVISSINITTEVIMKDPLNDETKR